MGESGVPKQGVPNPDALPADLEHPPPNRYKWDFPTAWLLGTQLIWSLRDMLMSAIADFDNRDWMSVNGTIPLSETTEGPDGPEAWLDFIADSGDSPRLVYQLAYLVQQPTLRVLVKQDGKDHELTRELPRGSTLMLVRSPD